MVFSDIQTLVNESGFAKLTFSLSRNDFGFYAHPQFPRIFQIAFHKKMTSDFPWFAMVLLGTTETCSRHFLEHSVLSVWNFRLPFVLANMWVQFITKVLKVQLHVLFYNEEAPGGQKCGFRISLALNPIQTRVFDISRRLIFSVHVQYR